MDQGKIAELKKRIMSYLPSTVEETYSYRYEMSQTEYSVPRLEKVLIILDTHTDDAFIDKALPFICAAFTQAHELRSARIDVVSWNHKELQRVFTRQKANEIKTQLPVNLNDIRALTDWEIEALEKNLPVQLNGKGAFQNGNLLKPRPENSNHFKSLSSSQTCHSTLRAPRRCQFRIAL